LLPVGTLHLKARAGQEDAVCGDTRRHGGAHDHDRESAATAVAAREESLFSATASPTAAVHAARSPSGLALVWSPGSSAVAHDWERRAAAPNQGLTSTGAREFHFDGQETRHELREAGGDSARLFDSVLMRRVSLCAKGASRPQPTCEERSHGWLVKRRMCRTDSSHGIAEQAASAMALHLTGQPSERLRSGVGMEVTRAARRRPAAVDRWISSTRAWGRLLARQEASTGHRKGGDDHEMLRQPFTWGSASARGRRTADHTRY